MVAVLLVGSLQAWFLVLLLLSKRGKGLPDYVLATWLALIGAHTGSLYLHHLQGTMPTLVLQLSTAFPFLQGPFLYLYVVSLTSRKPRLGVISLIHFLPFTAFLYHQLSSPAATGAHGSDTVSLLSIQYGFGVWLLASVPIYIVASLRCLRRYGKRLRATRSNVDRVHLRWLKILVAGMGFVWLAVVLTAVFQSSGSQGERGDALHLIFPALTLFIYAIGYFGFGQAAIGRTKRVPGAEASRDEPQVGDRTGTPPRQEPQALLASDPPDKYHKSGLGSGEAEMLQGRLLQLMEREQPYLDPDLTLGELSDRLASPTNHVSQMINELQGESFYDFVNRYRVEKAAALLRDPAQTGTTVLDIAFESGFGSKSTFNRVFRERIGRTPSQYRR